MSRFIKASPTVTQYHYQMHQYYASSNANVYIPFGADTAESPYNTDAWIDNNVWIPPFDGKLITAKYYQAGIAGDIDLFLSVDGTTGATLLGGGAVTVAQKTVATFSCTQNNTFSAGDIIRVWIQPDSTPKQVTMSTVWELT